METSFCTPSPALDYFSFASYVDDDEDVTNASYKDLLLALQKKQTNKVTKVAFDSDKVFEVCILNYKHINSY